MNKNKNHFLAFNKDWFKKHQKVLLWFLNTRLTRVWFRWVLRITGDSSEVKKNAIFYIAPNVIPWRNSKGRSYEFRTHWKFSKRIYYAFKPIWWLVHFWDWMFAERFYPQWSFGLPTLTAYPDADPETSTTDGGIINDPAGDETWANIRGAADGTSATPTAASGVMVRLTTTATTDTYDVLARSIFLFDTFL